MNKKIGFIGCGNMAKAMIYGILKSNIVDRSNIIVSANTEKTLENIKKEYGVKTSLENKKVARIADFLIISVKPCLYSKILEEVKDVIRAETIVISIGAGISLEFLKHNLREGSKFIRTMPNTPALVGEAMSALSLGEGLTDQEIKDVLNIYRSFGRVEIIEENLMDAFTAISGSSPAYIFMLIEAMADAGVREGVKREKAYTMVAQAILGSAKLVLETGEHPGKLKDNVCSPGGTAIEGVTSLEKNGFRASIIESIGVCVQKSKSMQK